MEDRLNEELLLLLDATTAEVDAATMLLLLLLLLDPRERVPEDTPPVIWNGPE